MADDHDLMTEAGLLAHLAAIGWKVKSSECLTGGTANYVYRVTREDSTCIVKHAEPHLRINKDFALDPARMDFEAKILRAVPLIEQPSETRAHAVELVTYDAARKLLYLEDGGERNLKEAYTDPMLDMRQIAFDLAKWLATLHNNSRNNHNAVTQNSVRSIGDNELAAKLYRHSYNNLHLALQKYSYDVGLAERINNEFGSLLTTDKECLCHGDFWPGNVLVKANVQTPKIQSTVSDALKHPTELTIVDWEMSRQGTSATDVGQFAAEAFLLDGFRGNRGLRVDFLDAYILARRWDKNNSVGKQWIIRMAIHWAVHVAYWPTRVPWTDESGTNELVNIGVGVMKLALAGDWDGLKQSPFFRGIQYQEWDTAFLQD